MHLLSNFNHAGTVGISDIGQKPDHEQQGPTVATVKVRVAAHNRLGYDLSGTKVNSVGSTAMVCYTEKAKPLALPRNIKAMMCQCKCMHANVCPVQRAECFNAPPTVAQY